MVSMQTTPRLLRNPVLPICRRKPSRNVDIADAGSHSKRIFKVFAGLNYPHMPTRLRRQRQELVYRFRQQRDRALTSFRKSPIGDKFISFWQRILKFLDPLLNSLTRLRDYLKWIYREQVFDFYDFTMDETKRKYKWEAYTEQEKKWWLDTLNYFGDRVADSKEVWFCAVVVGFTAFIVAMPCSVLWTLVVPYLLAWKNLEHGKGLWPYFWVVVLVMQPLKHDISRPIRWLI